MSLYTSDVEHNDQYDQLESICPLCNARESEVVYEDENNYLFNVDIVLHLTISICKRCGFVFQSSAYNEQYDRLISECYEHYDKNTIFPFPNKSLENIRTMQMILEHVPNESHFNILEIGSNRGDMLYMIKTERPFVNILGIDPVRYDCISEVPTIRKYYEKNMFSNKFDMIILQHVLEHIKYPRKFIENISHVLSEDGVIYIEVPSLRNILHYSVDDFTGDHVSYFDIDTLG